jgi:cobalt-zinc-cadmium efflux system protein
VVPSDAPDSPFAKTPPGAGAGVAGASSPARDRHQHAEHSGSHDPGTAPHSAAHDHGDEHDRVHEHGRQPARAEEHGHEHHGHGHGHHGHHHDTSAVARRALSTALALTSAFMLIEAVIGIYTGSLALLADAGHMLADAGALGLALAAQKFAERPRTERSTFGFRRAEVLAAFVNGMTLAGVAVLILKEAVERWMTPRVVDGELLLWTASAGFCVNLVVAGILLRGQKHSVNVRAAFAHVLSDALGSVAAMLAGVSVLVWGAYRADPLLSGAIAVLVAVSGFRILKETAAILLEGAPPNIDVRAVEKTIRECPGVAEVHDLHVWRISERFDNLTVHVVLQRGHHGTDVCRGVADELRKVHGLSHVTVQPEPPRPDDLVELRRSRDGAPLRNAG